AMIWLYRLLFPVGFMIGFPYYLRRMLRRGGYGKNFGYRLGLWPRLPEKPKGVRRIWIQAVSVGELLALGSLLRRLSRNESIEIVLTTTTSTGYKVALDRYRELALAIGPFPLDFLFCSRRAWNRIRPDLAVMVDSELWPEHMRQARNRGVPVVIVNARLSDRSYRRLSKVNCFRKLLLPQELQVVASSQKEAEKWRQLGISPDRLETSGNLKFDHQPEVVLDESAKAALRAEFGFSPSRENERRPVILLGASTWPGEEEALLRFLEANVGEDPSLRLVLAPRHAERGDELAILLNGQSFSWKRRSNEDGKDGEDIRVYLADTTGELPRLMQAADLVFIGKTLGPDQGGQNPVEAASCGIPVIFGPNTQNFSEMCRTLAETGAGLRVNDEEGLQRALTGLVRDEAKRTVMGKAARQWKKDHEGATEITCAKLLQLLVDPLDSE
ncbi:MAG: glycosyltransferase N-terminal domain-containing protein, partial [Opitutales bacterium]